MKKEFVFLYFVLLSLIGHGQNYIEDINRIKAIDIDDYQQNICISRDKKFIAIATLKVIKIVDIQNFKIIKLIPVSFKNIKSLSFLASSDNVLIVGNYKDSSSAEIYNWREKALIKKVNPIEKGEMVPTVTTDISGDFLVSVDKKNQLFVRNINSLELIIKIPPAGKENWSFYPTINKDGSLIAVMASSLLGRNTTLYVYNSKGELKYSQPTGKLYSNLAFNDSNELLAVSCDFPVSKRSGTTVYNININSGKSTTIAAEADVPLGHVIFSSSGNFLCYEGSSWNVDGEVGWNLKLLSFDGTKMVKIVSNDFDQVLSVRNDNYKRYPCIEISDGKYLISSGYDNFNYLVDSKNKEILGFLFHSVNSLAFVSSDGRFTGDNDAVSNLIFKIPGRSDIRLSSQIDQLYTPKLFTRVLHPSDIAELSAVDLNKILKMAPELKIISPDTSSNQKSNFVRVRYTVKDNGDGIKEIKFYVNGKLLNDEFRGEQTGQEKSRDILLINGNNIIEVVAISNNGYQSSPERIVARYKEGGSSTNLFILGIGIDKYKNPKYNLNYAVTDASSLTEYIKSASEGIFSNIDTKVLTDEMATKANIVEELNRISGKIAETDVFILFYAGHGVMSEGSAGIPRDYFLFLTDIIQMYGNDISLAEKGISASELREWCKTIKAQKQVIFLDACQSGGATEIFAMRGASEEKAIIQLAQSTGVFLISSAGAEQFATEYAVLKHGLFTYALLEGLGGKADGGSKDGKITIKEIEAWLNDVIPELSQKYKGSMQFPNTWSKGMDFPVVITR